MISILLQGGLGNQLFQLYAYISFCMDTRDKIVIPRKKMDKYSQHGHLRDTYWDTLFNRLQIFLNDTDEIYRLPYYKEPFFYHVPLIKYNDVADYKFKGYFQSWKYFDKYYYKINKIIGIEKKKLEIKNKYKQYNNKLISIHFRIGDYMNIQDSHPLLCNQYYFNAIDFLVKKTNHQNLTFLIFYEECDLKQIKIKIKILKKRYPNLNFIKIDIDIPDYEQLLIMSNCQHNIIANSSFSWWGAYYNENKEKIVCYPDVWFGKKLNHNTKDLCHPTWNKINNN